MAQQDHPRYKQVTAVSGVQVIRHAQLCNKLKISSAKLFDMCAKGLFPKPFQLIPGGRAVGWLEHDVDSWILNRKNRAAEVQK